MSTQLPTDANGREIQCLGLKDGAYHALTAGNAASRNQEAFSSDTKVIFITTADAVHIKFGDNSVAATTDDHKLPAVKMFPLKTGAATHISVLRSGDEDVAVDISEAQ